MPHWRQMPTSDAISSGKSISLSQVSHTMVKPESIRESFTTASFHHLHSKSGHLQIVATRLDALFHGERPGTCLYSSAS